MKNNVGKMICKCGHKKEDHLAEKRMDENQPLKRIKRYFQCKIKGCLCKEFNPKSQIEKPNNKKRGLGIKLFIRIILASLIMVLLWNNIENPSNNPWIFLWGIIGVILLFWIFNIKEH